MATATTARLLVVGVLGVTAARCGGDSPASPSTPPTPVQSTVAVASAPTPLVAAHATGDPDTTYRITANLTFQETGGKAARITRLQVVVSGASGWSSSTVHHVDIQVAARGTSTYTLTSVVDVGGPDTTGTWKLDASGTDADGAALGCKQAQSDLRIVDPPVPDAVLLGAGDMAGYGIQNRNSSRMRDAWRLLQQSGAEFVVSGHDHTYERFAPQDADGRANPSGLRQFVVGTGGYSLYDLGHRQPNSEVFENKTWGVIKFTLKRKSYEWEFVPIDGQTFRDSGSGACSVPAAQ